MKRPLLNAHTSLAAVALAMATCAWLFLAPTVARVDAQTDDSASPSPSPVVEAAPSARPGAVYVGSTATGAPIRIEVSPDGQFVSRYDVGRLDPDKRGAPIFTFEPQCATLGANAVGFSMGKNVPIVNDHFNDGARIEGTFRGDTVSGVFTFSMKAGDPGCTQSTEWTAQTAS